MAKNRFDNLFEEGDAAFDKDKNYQEKLNAFKGLSEEQINAITPDTLSKESYEKIVTLVNKATETNMSQADLISNIKILGETAVSIAKKIPALATLF